MYQACYFQLAAIHDRCLYGRVLFFSLILFSKITVYAQVVGNEKENYKIVRINDQQWMLENLNVVTFRNGDSIPQAVSDEAWVTAGNEGRPAWCYYENKMENGIQYGKLYNWYAVNDARGLAPKGWHIPTDKEWSMTTLFLGGEDAAGTKMKSSKGWQLKGDHNNEALKESLPVQEKSDSDGYGNGTNESGFTGLPAGSRDRFGKFEYIGHVTYWWTATVFDAEFAWYRAIDETPWYVYRTSYYKQNGYSVRCIKD